MLFHPSNNTLYIWYDCIKLKFLTIGNSKKRIGAMDLGIRASWYDLPKKNGKEEFFSWLHDTCLPSFLQRPGTLWVAHYEITGGDWRMEKLQDTIPRPAEHLWEEIGNGTNYLLLEGAGSPQIFFNPDYEE